MRKGNYEKIKNNENFLLNKKGQKIKNNFKNKSLNEIKKYHLNKKNKKQFIKNLNPYDLELYTRYYTYNESDFIENTFKIISKDNFYPKMPKSMRDKIYKYINIELYQKIIHIYGEIKIVNSGRNGWKHTSIKTVNKNVEIYTNFNINFFKNFKIPKEILFLKEIYDIKEEEIKDKFELRLLFENRIDFLLSFKDFNVYLMCKFEKSQLKSIIYDLKHKKLYRNEEKTIENFKEKYNF